MMNKSSHRQNRQTGYTLLEVLIYASGLVMLAGAISGFLFYMYGWYQSATISSRIDQVAISLATRLEGDIRSGTSIDLSGSTLDADLGTIAIESISSDSSTTTVYSLSSGRVTWSQNGGGTDYLTPADMNITRFRLTPIDTPVSSAIRFEIEALFTQNKQSVTRSYEGLAILRRSY